MPCERWAPSGAAEEAALPLTDETITRGWAVAAALFTAGHMLKTVIPIHYFAITIILTALVKIAHVLPDDVEQSAGHFYRFVASGFYGPLLLGIGLTHLRLDMVAEALTPQFLLLSFLAVLGAAVGAGLAGKLLRLYPVESALTGGLCMANMGGSGDIAVLAGAHRMELMPFAQISSRIGGALMLVIAQLMIGVLGRFL
jgi:Na+/citrate or Na+/malate symporter